MAIAHAPPGTYLSCGRYARGADALAGLPGLNRALLLLSTAAAAAAAAAAAEHY